MLPRRTGTGLQSKPLWSESKLHSCYDGGVSTVSKSRFEPPQVATPPARPEEINTFVDDADSLWQLGADCLAAGEPTQAAAAFRKLIALVPNHVEAHHGLIRALRDAGEWEPAVAIALALTVLTPNDPLAHTSLSIALQQAGHIPQAESAAARARILEWKQQLALDSDALGESLA